MRYNQLGNTGLFVSEMCLGTMTFGNHPEQQMWTHIAGLGQDSVNAIVERSLAAGINFIDTADVYSGGESERLLGQSLKDLGVKRGDVVIATKVFGAMGDGPNDRGLSRGHIMDAAEQSLKRLNTGHIDLYQCHCTDPCTPVDEILRAMDDLVSQGLVRYVGISNWQAWRIAKALGVSALRGFVRPQTVQAYYSIAGRDVEREIVPLATEEKLGIMVWSPLAGGLLSGKYTAGESGRRGAFAFPPVDEARADACIAAMRDVAAKHGASVASVALAWLLTRPGVMSIIIGAKTIEQLDQNIAATGVRLDAEDLARLDEVSKLPGEYPGWMLDFQIRDRPPPPFNPAS